MTNPRSPQSSKGALVTATRSICPPPNPPVNLRPMSPQDLRIAEFQKHIADKYEATDRARGTPRTWMWFIEEIGELSHALAKGDDRANLEEEFADVVAWLCTLANINDVDLSAALIRKYLSAAPP